MLFFWCLNQTLIILQYVISNIGYLTITEILQKKPIDKFYKGITYNFFKSKIKKITRKDIFVNNLKEFDEIILIGSGKGVASVKTISQLGWKRKSLKNYNILSKYYKSAVTKCKVYR